MELDKETSTFILRIRDIQETDGATYQCQVLFFNLPKNRLALVQPTGAIKIRVVRVVMLEIEVILPCNAQDHGIVGL